uniref:CRIB domain-containing protein n=1 Tax=Calidris pygmaea TaxID=425635 RepID=A0A8C3PHR4_9CHAR
MNLNQMVSLPAFQKRRRRIDRSMIGEPTNFVHTAHVGSGDLFSGMNSKGTPQPPWAACSRALAPSS